MIYRLLARVRELAKSEYWRTRCLKAEAQLEAERWRDIERSDTFTTMLVSSMTGIVGIHPRRGPAQIPQQPATPIQPLRALDPWDELGPVDRMEFETQWLPDAKARNVPLAQAKQMFVEMVAKRKMLNDDYQM